MFKIVHPSGGYTSVSNNFSSLTMGTLRNDSLHNLQYLTENLGQQKSKGERASKAELRQQPSKSLRT